MISLPKDTDIKKKKSKQTENQKNGVVASSCNPGTQRLRWENGKPEDSLGYRVRSSLKELKKINKLDFTKTKIKNTFVYQRILPRADNLQSGINYLQEKRAKDSNTDL